MEDIPEDEDKCSAWLHKLYQEKVGVPVGFRVQDVLMGGHWEPVIGVLKDQYVKYWKNISEICC